MRVLTTIFSAAAIAAMLAAPASARADDFNKLTYLTFSGPVQVPGHTLVAGTYTFKLADAVNDRHIVQIFDKATSKLIATIMTIPDQRLDPTDKTVVMFKETPAGTPAAVQAWFYPGNSTGNEFIYPRRQAMRIAKATHTPVMAMADNTSESDMKGAAIGRIDENGNASDEKGRPAATATAATSGTMEPDTAAPPPTTTTAEPMRHARRLPQTASPFALYELISGLSLAGAYGIRRFRTR